MRSPVFLCFVAIVALAFPVVGQEILPLEQRDFSHLLPPPPSDDSPAGLADLDTVLQLQHDRTPAQITRAHRVSHQSVFTFAQPVLGDWFTAANLPRTAAIFAEVDHEDVAIVEAAKRVAHRPRPYQRDPRVHPAVSKAGEDNSYPSGHTMGAAVWGTLLAAAFPADKAGFEDQIHETMWCRQIGGVHFPTDTESGQIIGRAVAAKMLATPAMEHDLAEIRAEVAPFQKAPSAPAAPTP